MYCPYNVFILAFLHSLNDMGASPSVWGFNCDIPSAPDLYRGDTMLRQLFIFLSLVITVLVNFETRVPCFLFEEKPFSADLVFFFVWPPALLRPQWSTA